VGTRAVAFGKSSAFEKTPRRKKEKQLVDCDYQNVNSLCSRHHYASSVFLSGYGNTIFNQSARVFS